MPALKHPSPVAYDIEAIPRRVEDRPEVYESGRRCSHKGCSTYLSQYNPDDQCWSHRHVGEPVNELAELMGAL